MLHPEEWMRKILAFLDIPWNESVLHHEEFINKPNGVSLSKYVRLLNVSFAENNPVSLLGSSGLRIK